MLINHDHLFSNAQYELVQTECWLYSHKAKDFHDSFSPPRTVTLLKATVLVATQGCAWLRSELAYFTKVMAMLPLEVMQVGARLGLPSVAALLSLDPAATLAAVHTHKVLHLALPPTEPLTEPEMVQWFSQLATPLPQRGREHAKGAVCDEIFVLRDLGETSPFLSNAPLDYHSDLSYRKEPGTLSALYAVATPDSGGDTIFQDCTKAFAGLGPELQERCRGLRACHRHPEPHMNPDLAGVVHPLVRRHPETKEETLFLSPFFTKGSAVPGVADDAMLDQLNALLKQPALQYIHRWSVGDLVLWDNVTSVHGRTAFVGVRELWRCQSRGAF